MPLSIPNPQWETRAPQAAPSGEAVQVWRLRLDRLAAGASERFEALTVPAEHARARRFRLEADRRRHLAGRALVRAVLGRRFDREPTEFGIAEGEDGKPRLVEADGGAWESIRFNLSHAEDLVVCALSASGPVGVDVEPLDRTDGADGVARRVLTQGEFERWKACSGPRREAFFMHLWTAKEAVLKATGEGLRRAPETLECEFEGRRVRAVSYVGESASVGGAQGGGRWSIAPFVSDDAYIGALSRAGAPGERRVEFWDGRALFAER